MLGYEKRRSLKRVGPLLDKINIVLCVLMLVSAVMIIVNMKKFMIMFPVMFSMAALMNLSLAIKSYKMGDMTRMIPLIIACIGLTVLSIIGYVVVL